MRYIRQIRVAYPGQANHHITHVRYAETPFGPLREASRDRVAHDIENSGIRYRSRNDLTGREAIVDVRSTVLGQRYITTVADGRETNNLLSLPRF